MLCALHEGVPGSEMLAHSYSHRNRCRLAWPSPGILCLPFTPFPLPSGPVDSDAVEPPNSVPWGVPVGTGHLLSQEAHPSHCVNT